MAKIVQASDLRSNLADVLDAVSGKEKYLLISRNREVDAVIVGIDFFEEMLASMSPEYKKSIKEARKQFENGDTLSHEEVFGKL